MAAWWKPMSEPVFARRRLLTATIAALLAGCSTLSGKAPEKPPVAAPVAAKPRIGLALGGGAARGFAHIGVIKVLESHGIVADYVVGTSAGAVVGSLYAAGHDAFAMQKIAQQLDEKIFADWTLGGRGFLKGEALQDFVNQHLGRRPLEKLNKPFATVATDLNSGERVVFRTGDSGLAVRASAAVPGVFQPTQFRGRSYVDGGLTSPVPVQAAREMGADIVIAVDISDRPEGQPVEQPGRDPVADDDHHGRHHRRQRAEGGRRRHPPEAALRQVLGFHRPPRRHARRRTRRPGCAAGDPPETRTLTPSYRPPDITRGCRGGRRWSPPSRTSLM